MSAINSRSRRSIRRGALATLALAASLVAGAAPASAATCPNEAIREQQGSTYLPDCRAYELASPVNKNEQEVEGPTQFVSEVAFKGAASGSGVAFTLTGAIPDSLSGGLYSEALATSAAPGSPWAAQPQNPQNALAILPSNGPKSAGEFFYYAPDLSCGVISTPLAQAAHIGETTPLLAPPTEYSGFKIPGETAGEKVGKLYRWVKGSSPASDTYSLITSIRPANPTGESEQPYFYSVDGASEGCKKVIYENKQSGYNLAGDPIGSLYESSEETGPRLASVLPDGTPAVIDPRLGSLGGKQESNLNQISSDGSRVFFSAESDGKGAGEATEEGAQEVFARENGSSTVSASKSQGPVPTHGARFQAASHDGSVVFFTANYGLTSGGSTSVEANELCERTHRGDSSAAPGTGHCDLYSFNLNTHTLTDLSPDPSDVKGANVRGVVGIAEDGSAIYFSASGQLVAGKGNTAAENEAKGEANVYEYRTGRTPALAYVATIGTEEAGSNNLVPQHQIDAVSGDFGKKYLVARVSADGHFLLLASRKQLTAYDNRQQGTETREWEEYEYSDAAGAPPVCVSCRPDGAAPKVKFTNEPFATIGLYIDATRTTPRNLAADGRVFFDSIDPLVERVTNENVNAYEWTPRGVAGCESEKGCVGVLDSGTDSFPSYFEDASLDGQDVYVTTHAQLAPQDTDGLRDIYDVRVNGGIPATPATPECSGEACQGPLGGGIGGALHASETAKGGNPPLTPPPSSGVAPPEAGVKGFIRRRLSRSHRVLVTVIAPAAGRISVTGHGLKRRKLSVAKAGKYVVSVALTRREIKTLKHKRRLRLTVRVSFASATGHASATKSTITVR
jgi:hypothetical protein